MAIDKNDIRNVGSTPSIALWGDSLTNNEYVRYISLELPGRLVTGYGIPGQTAQQIASRQGGLPLQVSIAGGAFSGTSTLSVTALSSQFLSTAADSTPRIMSGLLGGVQCFIARSALDAYTIAPGATSTASVADGSVFYPDDGFNSRICIQLIWVGRNNVGGASISDVPDTVDGMIAAIAPPRRFVVTGILNSLTETIGTAEYTAISAVNAELLARYGDLYVSTEPCTDEEAEYFAYTLTSDDLAKRALKTWSANFRTDELHFNTLGYRIMARRAATVVRGMDY